MQKTMPPAQGDVVQVRIIRRNIGKGMCISETGVHIFLYQYTGTMHYRSFPEITNGRIIVAVRCHTIHRT